MIENPNQQGVPSGMHPLVVAQRSLDSKVLWYPGPEEALKDEVQKMIDSIRIYFANLRDVVMGEQFWLEHSEIVDELRSEYKPSKKKLTKQEQDVERSVFENQRQVNLQQMKLRALLDLRLGQ